MAKANVPSRPDSRLVLYANGWIGETRGAPTFLEALNIALHNDLDVRLVIAGHVTGERASSLIRHPLVHFVGEITQSEALSWYAACDLLLTYYDPDIPINCKAQSNKWGDAVFMDTPFIVNCEVETAKPFVSAGVAWALPYSSSEALVALVEDLLKDLDLLEGARAKMRNLKKDYPTFDEVFAESIQRFELPGLQL